MRAGPAPLTLVSLGVFTGSESERATMNFSDLHRPLWDRLVDLAQAQIANIHIRPFDEEGKERHEKLAIDMRESLEYRFSAVGFHAGILRKHQLHGLKQLADQFPFGSSDSFDITYTARRHQQMLFDAVIFNILALFDYVGNAIGFSFHGANSGAMKWKWKRATQYIRDPSAEQRKHGTDRYSRSAVAPVVERVDREWISRLEEYRAELIHYKAEPAGGGHSFRFAKDEPATVSLTITTPPAFTKSVPMPGKARGEPVFIVEATDWLLVQTQASVLSIVDALTVELEREPAPPDGGLRVRRAS